MYISIHLFDSKHWLQAIGGWPLLMGSDWDSTKFNPTQLLIDIVRLGGYKVSLSIYWIPSFVFLGLYRLQRFSRPKKRHTLAVEFWPATLNYGYKRILSERSLQTEIGCLSTIHDRRIVANDRRQENMTTFGYSSAFQTASQIAQKMNWSPPLTNSSKSISN